MDEDNILAEGVYCTGCDFFEEEENVEGSCQSCGCASDMHVQAKIVRA